jgi:Spy/CpxP family protein refolding chaperone
MKTSLLSVIFAGAVLVAPPAQMTWADDTTTSGQTAPATGSQDQGPERLREAVAALDLTDAQKEQIKQIRANTPAGKERRQQILAVLTPEQKARLRQLILEHRDATQAGGASSANTGDN